jgi:hypothetical protein
VLDGAGEPLAGVRTVLTIGSDDPMGGSDEDVFSLDTEPERRVATDEGGTCRFEDVPADRPLVLELQPAGSPSVTEIPPLRLAAGEERELEWRLGEGTLLTGTMVDSHGVPVSNESLWLVRARKDGPTIFNADQRSEARRTVTDESGRFVFEDVGAGGWWLGPSAARRAEDAPDLEALAPYAERIELRPGESARDVRLVVHRGLFVRGMVVMPEGESADAVYVWASLLGLEPVSASAEPTAEGFFLLGPLVPGRYELTAQKLGAGLSEPVVAEPGAEGVRLILRPGGTLTGGVRFPPGSEGMTAVVSVRHAGTGRWQLTNADAFGSVRFEGLAEGTYDVCARAGGAWFGHRSGVVVRAGTEAHTELVLARGARVRLRNASGVRLRCLVLQAGACLADEWLGPEGVLERLVAAGELVVETSAGDEPRTQGVTLASGERRELVLAR